MELGMILRNVILFLGAVICFRSARALPLEKWQVSAGEFFACALDDSGVQCWGNVEDGQGKVPALQNPRQLSAGDVHACALDDNGVQCWGDGKYDVVKVPSLKHPRQVSAGGNQTCAIDDEGVHCWGDHTGQSPVPMLKNPKQVSVGYGMICAIDDDGAHCWGQEASYETEVPNLKNPTQVVAGETHACAIDDKGVSCWGDNEYGQTNVPALQNPRQVTVGIGHTCALDEKGVKCWGWDDEGQIDVPALKNPRQVTAGNGFTCALDDEGVHCWGLKEYNKDDKDMSVTEVPMEATFLSFQVIQRTSPLSHLHFYLALSELEKIISSNSSIENKYLFYALLGPAIEQTHTDYYQKVLIPRYQWYVSDLRSKTALPEGLQEIQDSEKNRQIALKIIQASFQVAFEFLSATEKAELQPVMQKIGTAYADANDVNIKAVLLVLKKKKSLLATLKNSERSAFSADVIDLAANWLNAKIPL
jgi:hypothetical protein